MNLPFKKLADIAIEAAKTAGKLIAEKAHEKFSVNTKCGGDSLASQVFTEVDLISQQIILDFIKPTCEEYDIALLAEESADDHSRFEKDYFWCIDPLDGTLPFIEQTPGYSVSIALVSKSGEPQIGVIYDPVEHILYHAIKGHGFFINGKQFFNEKWSAKLAHHFEQKLSSKILLSGRAKNSEKIPLTFITDRSFLKHPKIDQILVELELIAKELNCQGIETISHGGAAMNAIWVLKNSPACYFKFPKPQQGGGSLWDFAATACIFNEVGAHASDIYGHPLDLNRCDSTFMNHKGILFASDAIIADKVQSLFLQIEQN